MSADEVFEFPAFQPARYGSVVNTNRGVGGSRRHRSPSCRVDARQAVHLLTRETFDYTRCRRRYFRLPLGCKPVLVLKRRARYPGAVRRNSDVAGLVVALEKVANDYQIDLPDNLAGPARRALLQAGLRRLEQVQSLHESELLRLHGIGPRAIEQLRRALDARGQRLKGD